MHTSEYIFFGPDRTSETSLSFQRLAENRRSRGQQQLIDRCFETYALLSLWNRQSSVCLAGLLSMLMIHDDCPRDLYWVNFVDAIDESVKCLATRVANLPASISPMKLAFGSGLEIADNNICDIIAALSMVIARTTQNLLIADLKCAISRISDGMCLEAYEYWLSSNVLLGIPQNIHEVAKQHAMMRLRESMVQFVPCRHALVTEIFPDSYYAAMLHLLPSPEDFRPIPTADAYDDACRERLGIAGRRYTLWLRDLKAAVGHSRNFERDQKSRFWCSLAELLADSSFVASVVAAFMDNSQEEFDVAIRLVREVGVAYIPPHLDMSHKRLSLLFYLADTDDGLTQGTSLYTVDGYSGRTEVQKTYPFFPNSVLVVPRTEESMHGVEPHHLALPRVTLHAYLQRRSYEGTKVFPPS